MRRIETLRAQIEQWPEEFRRVGQELVTSYEQELADMTRQLAQTYEELVLLYDLGERVVTLLDENAVAEVSLQEIGDLLAVEGGCVCLRRDAGQRPEDWVVQNTTRPLSAADERVLHQASAAVLERERPRIVNNVAEAFAVPGTRLCTLLSAPLRVRERTIGVLHVFNKEDGEFRAEDMKLLSTVATQAAIAMDNSRLLALERQRRREVEQTYQATLQALSNALDLRDTETQEHALRVQEYTVRLARELDLTGEHLTNIRRGALLHDIGKIGVPDRILLKPGKLTPEEWKIMTLHPTLGHQMIQGIEFLEKADPIVLYHHERYDGQGYPHGLAGEDIPIDARLFAVADALDAITSERPYRQGQPYAVARAEIEKNAHTQFDPLVVDLFLRVPPEEWEDIRHRVAQALKTASNREDEFVRLVQQIRAERTRLEGNKG
ncbi:MAG TPA: HD domain-containing protein [Armatimonadetes bacterium]|nr:HD domain-containing protein [Armatimonadota bacterium]